MYKDYLLDLVLESTLDPDTMGNCIEMIESLENIKEVASFGSSLTDALELYESGDISKEDFDEIMGLMVEEVEAEDLTLKEKLDKSGASTSKIDEKKNPSEYELDWYEGIEQKFSESIDIIGDQLVKGVDTLTSAINDYVGKAMNSVKVIDSEDKKTIILEIGKMKDDVKELKADCKSGKIDGKEAKTRANKIVVKAKLIVKKIRGALDNVLKKKDKVTEESVLNAIYEASAEGTIDVDDVEFLTSALME